MSTYESGSNADAMRVDHAYGPVPSRRLGKSLGINNIPPKICTYSCVYCQIGRTTQMQDCRKVFYDPDEIVQDVRNKLQKARAASEKVDYLTFVPDGEPTLDINLGKEIEALKTLGVPVGVITNASLLWRDDVREDLSKADWISVKVDSVDEGHWRQINRPCKGIQLSAVLDGLLAFSKRYTGKLVTETMLVKGLNDNEGCMKAVADYLHILRPEIAYLSIPTRPPMEGWVSPPEEGTLNLLWQILADRVKQVEYLIDYEGDSFTATDNVEQSLLNITAVHPMREEAVRLLLSRAGYSWDTVSHLMAQGVLTKTDYNGHVFYLRKFTKNIKPGYLKKD